MTRKKKTLEDHEAETGSWFCAVTHDLSLAENIKTAMLDFPSWAWIFHNPDSDDGSDHIHFLFSTNGTRSIRQVADKIQLPSNFIQKCRNVVGYRRYMLHLDNPEKIQYSVNEVHTRCHSDFRQAEEGTIQKTIFSIYKSYEALSQGLMTPLEFLQENSVEMDKMPFAQKIKTIQIINQAYIRRTPT